MKLLYSQTWITVIRIVSLLFRGFRPCSVRLGARWYDLIISGTRFLLSINKLSSAYF
jgi:hypothetical protein